METLRVNLGARSYEIRIGSDMLGGIGPSVQAIGASPKIAVISSYSIFPLYGGRVMESLRQAGFFPTSILLPDGEETKSMHWAEYVLTELLKLRLDRGSIIVALGGGVIGDLTGFVASLYMRGIRFVQIPTTLLAQVDSSVGGKTGVNHLLGKNMIGTFWQPSLVCIDTETLTSLPRREFVSGMAEVIKYGVIYDRAFFDHLKSGRDAILALDPEALANIITRSCAIKAEVVGEDERESGLRAILNFGHTIGHAIENATGYKQYLHGEAVSIGMCAEARLSARLGIMTGPEAVAEISGLYGLPSEIPAEIDRSVLLGAMEIDKKALHGAIRFILPERIGTVRINVPVDRETIAKTLGAVAG